MHRSSENVAAIAMEKIRNGAENFSLRALARTGRAKHENRPVFHGKTGSRVLSVKN